MTCHLGIIKFLTFQLTWSNKCYLLCIGIYLCPEKENIFLTPEDWLWGQALNIQQKQNQKKAGSVNVKNKRHTKYEWLFEFLKNWS